MMDVSELVANYVAAWNEPDPDMRRRRIRSVWAPDRTTCHRLLDARGYEAIEARITGSWDKWLREGNRTFRAKSAVWHHQAVKLDFVMVKVPDGDVEANGLSFLLLNPDNRIKHDYQFNPGASDSNDLVDRYVAVWNQLDPTIRRAEIAQLWSQKGMLIRARSVSVGHAAIEAAATRAFDAHVGKGRVASSTNSTHAHHDLVKFGWKLASADDGVASAAWSDLLVLDEDGRICFDYQFDETR
jgi:hypothetical protein